MYLLSQTMRVAEVGIPSDHDEDKYGFGMSNSCKGS